MRKPETNIWAFLEAVPSVNPMSQQIIIHLANRFCVSPEGLSILIAIASKGILCSNN